MKFMVWSDSYNEESGADAVHAFSSEMAAESWVEMKHGSLDYPTEQEVSVKSPQGTVTHWTVFVESRPHFDAVPRDVPAK